MDLFSLSFFLKCCNHLGYLRVVLSFKNAEANVLGDFSPFSPGKNQEIMGFSGDKEEDNTFISKTGV